MQSDGSNHESIPSLIERIDGAEADEREAAIEVLIDRAPGLDSGGVGDLLDALDHPRPEVRLHVSAALGLVDRLDAASAERIARALRDNDPTVRGNAALALGRIGARAAVHRVALDFALQTEEDDWAGAVMLEALRRIDA
jgi:HEAT repeat protein